ncbi:long-chain-fatty-acid--CoA ligase [Enterovibrio paralichthyis]|uniref:long-chain-fatty-acid--CoA ligase n=1 Tax=Enterovibrio paralichthyis TaxID=2853805 RepID=UPI001C45DD5C|nr:long-chain fatty acid--CoA ligase [Enterovibrio paralichthyis]MBV7297410.1 long-chain fatty acid--CoA ligase [Enterovibrio paralichthyis]
MHNLAVNLERSAALFPQKTALNMGNDSYSYAQLDALASKVAHNLVRLGLKPGDKVALSCPNIPYFPIAYYGILKAGCVVVPLNVLFKQREIAYHLGDSGAKAYLCFDGTEELPIGKFGRDGFDQADKCEHFVAMPGDPTQADTSLAAWLVQESDTFNTIARNGDDTAVILYTSGTTGQPKGAELSHTNMMTNAMSSQYLMRLEHKDTTMATLPLFHSFGQTVMMNASILTGAAIVLIPRFDPASVITQIIARQVTVFAGVPTMYIALLTASEQAEEQAEQVKQSLRVCISGGASMPVEIIRQFESRFEVPILEGYGLSETAPVATFNHLDSDRLPGSVGQPLCGHLVKTVDLAGNTQPVGEHGEICVKSPSVMKGYYNRPEATEAAFIDGWFKTGDVGHIDEHGNLFIVDRVKDMIIRGGYNVYPREIEEVMMCHPDIEMVAVVGEPHQSLGEEIYAHVRLKADAQTDSEALIAWCKEQLADYKYPRQIVIRTSFPMTATGKILKRELHPKPDEE